jgi:hypothetical protein
MKDFGELLSDNYNDMIDFIVCCKDNGISLDAATSRTCMYKGLCYSYDDEDGYIFQDSSTETLERINFRQPARRSYEQPVVDNTGMSAIDICRLVADTESIKECQVIIEMLEARIGELKCQS